MSESVEFDGSEERRRTLTILLSEYTEIISIGSHDLGRTKQEEHTIDTGNAYYYGQDCTDSHSMKGL